MGWSLFVFLLVLHSSLGLRCRLTDEKPCICIPGNPTFEFQCSSNDSGLIIVHVTEGKEILIDCPFSNETLDINILPNITVPKINKIWLRACSLPSKFKDVMDHFGVKEEKTFRFQSSDLSDITLTKEYFEGLGMLNELQFDGNDLVHLEDDVFLHLTGLISLELQKNKPVLPKNLFLYTPNLRNLDLSENSLEGIPEGLFKNLPKLEVLHMWGNNLPAINSTTFEGLTSLKSLELSTNNIQVISEDAFLNLPNLRRVNFAKNNLTTLFPRTWRSTSQLEFIGLNNNQKLVLPDFAFSNLRSLNTVLLGNCKMQELPEYLFANSSEIQKLQLSGNNLQTLPEQVFRDLTKLKELNLASNRIKHLGNIFAKLSELKILDLRDNQLVEIGKETFRGLTNLEEIYLQHNNIEKIDNIALHNNAQLRTIDLSENKYAGDGATLFSLLENVKALVEANLSHNRITRIEHVITLLNKVHMETLDLSYNEITDFYLSDLQPLSKRLTVNLEYNNITTVSFRNIDEITSTIKADASSNNDPYISVIYLSNNPIACTCHNFDLVRYFKDFLLDQVKLMFDIKADGVKCAYPPNLDHMELKTVPLELLVCSVEDGCPETSSCSRRPYDKALIIDFSAKNLTHFPKLNLTNVRAQFNHTEVHLERNRLSGGLNRSLVGYGSVSKLFLSYNQIEKVEWLPPEVEVLHLDHNRIEHLDYRILDRLNSSKMRSLSLTGNKWKCDCEAANLTSFLRGHSKKVIDAGHIFCANTTHRLIELNANDLCQTFGIAGVAIGILFILLLIAILTIMYFKYQQPLKVFLYAHNLCLWWVTEEDLDKDKIYDAFISYSHKDEDFVSQNLIPVLEAGPNPYKLCLHQRDFIPGEFILTQVTNSVLDSRRTLVVLSHNFLESVWGKAEFRTAHTHAMTEGRARVIIVLYGDIDENKVDGELKAYMKTNTYVKWGDPYFWSKLKYALPHSKRKGVSSQKIANVMNCIDDKFNLVAPVTPAPGSTPPVLNGDLKKHPLNFVPGKDANIPVTESGTLLVSTGL